MLKRKAIEAAMYCDCDDKNCSGKVWADIAAERAYEYGFVAGMRHAAKRAMALDGGWQPYTGQIQREARALAKKARAK